MNKSDSNGKKNINDKLNGFFHKGKHPVFKEKLTFSQKASDTIAKFGGSWVFIIIFMLTIFFWMILNSWFLLSKSFDPYPYILLNLVLSCVSALQAPIILMSQNREAERDRLQAKYDYQVNRKAEREIRDMQKDLDEIKDLIRKVGKR